MPKTNESPFSKRNGAPRWRATTSSPATAIPPPTAASARTGPVSPSLNRHVTEDNELGYAFRVTNKRLRAIAALEVELEMTEAHARRLSSVAPNSADPEHQHAMAALAKEENDRAELLRRQIHLLQGHV